MFDDILETAAAAWDSMLRRQLQERLDRDIHDSPQHTHTGRGRSANAMSNTIHNAIPTASSPVAQYGLGGRLTSNLGVAGLNAFTGTPPPPGYPPPTDHRFPPGYRPPPGYLPPPGYRPPPGYLPPLGYRPPPSYAYDLSTGVLLQGFQLTPVNRIPAIPGPVPVSTVNVATHRSRDLGLEVTQSEQ
jgi:hypothetical protein